MGTWSAAIVETRGAPDFWDRARAFGIAPRTDAVPPFVLVNADVRLGALHVPPFAEDLSRAVGGRCVAFFAQTTADVYDLHEYDRGTLVRRLEGVFEEGGWLVQEGTVRDWEPAFFFDDEGGVDDDATAWPDMLDDDLSDADVARYEAARGQRDPSAVMDLLFPSSTFPLVRVCRFFDVAPDAPHATWTPPRRGWFSRLFGG